MSYQGITFYVTVDGSTVKCFAPWHGSRELLTNRARDMAHRMGGILGGLCFEKDTGTKGTTNLPAVVAAKVESWLDKVGKAVYPEPTNIKKWSAPK